MTEAPTDLHLLPRLVTHRSADYFARTVLGSPLGLPDYPDEHFTGRSDTSPFSVSHEEGCLLRLLAHTFGGPILEIGSYAGVSSRYLHRGLESSPAAAHAGSCSTLFCVDPVHKWTDDADWNLRMRLPYYSDDPWLRIGLPPLTLTFIDGSHHSDAVLNDLSLAYHHHSEVIVLHDVNPSNQNPPHVGVASQAATFFLAHPSYETHLLPTRAGLLVGITTK